MMNQTVGAKVLPLIASCCMLIGSPPPVSAWQTVINGALAGVETGNGVAADPTGDVVAAGFTNRSDSGWNFTVVKLDGNLGAQQWRQDLDGDTHTGGQASAVTIDPAGDVIAVGWFDHFAVVKFQGCDGSILWQKTINGSIEVPVPPGGIWHPGNGDYAYAVTTDSSGDIVAVGQVNSQGGNFGYLFIVKLRGTDGTELWHYATAAFLGTSYAKTVRIDNNGDVLAAGSVGPDRVIVKLRGATGALLWQWKSKNGGGDSGTQQLELIGGTDVVTVGLTPLAYSVVVRLRGSDGATLWQYEPPNDIWRVAADPSGNVFAAGFELTKLEGVSGAELWRQEAQFAFFALTAEGDVIALGNFGGKWIQKLDGSTGGQLWTGTADASGQFVIADSLGNVVGTGAKQVLDGIHVNQEFVVNKLSGLDGTAFWNLRNCVGDCNNDGHVTIDELVTGVNIALGSAAFCHCRALDLDLNHQVTIDELLSGVSAALGGCQ